VICHILAVGSAALRQLFERRRIPPWVSGIAPGQRVGEDMTTILRKTAQAWLPIVMTAAVVGIGVAVATW